MKTLLEGKFGVPTKTAGNGQEAVDLIEGGSEFDLILMDINMPVMDGIEATKRIGAIFGERGHGCPIIGLSGYSNENIQKKCMEIGMQGYVNKPITSKQVDELIKRYLKR